MSRGGSASGGVDAAEDVDARWCAIVAAARRAWPTVDVAPEVFAAYLRERLPVDVPEGIALRQTNTSDLYLACACAHGDPKAFAAFDVRCLQQVDRVLGKVGLAGDVIAEVKHDVRVHLLVGNHGRAGIVDFYGRGDLRGWVNVIATRQALQRKLKGRREVATDDDELMQRIVAPDDPELDYVKRLYRDEFKEAFETVLRALPDREQTLLRQHYVDGLTLDELASLYRVHRATTARLLARARAEVLERTRARLMSRLDVSSSDLDSIIRMIWSKIEISLRGLRRGRRR